MSQDEICPCESGRPYARCCGPLHQGEPAQDAEALMRSRYCAYVRKLPEYLLATWHPLSRPETLDLETESPTWLGLRVVRHEQVDEQRATVEFVARYRVGGGRAVRHHELSRFVNIGGRWLYLEGKEF
jgi:SEC-C motif-containing protein